MKQTPSKEPSRPLSELPLVQQIDMIIAKNGAVSQDVKDMLMFSVVKTLIVSIEEIQELLNDLKERTTAADEKLDTLNTSMDKRVTILERRNVITWCIAHPKTALLILGLLAMLLLSHYGAFIFNYLGVKLPF